MSRFKMSLSPIDPSRADGRARGSPRSGGSGERCMAVARPWGGTGLAGRGCLLPVASLGRSAGGRVRRAS
jgi:hypothetical protein